MAQEPNSKDRHSQPRARLGLGILIIALAVLGAAVVAALVLYNVAWAEFALSIIVILAVVGAFVHARIDKARGKF